MPLSHCSLEYHEESFDTLPNTAAGVRDGWFNNTSIFTASPPITRTVFDGHIADFNRTYSAFKRGGADQKGAFLTALNVLMGDIDGFCTLVDTRAAGDETIIILGGFKPTKTTRTASTVPTTPIVTLERGDATGVIVAECAVVAGAEYYGAIIANKPLVATQIIDGGQLVIGSADLSSIVRIDVKKQRKKQFNNLTSGTPYTVYFYASNSAGLSQLSEARTIICG